MLFNKLRTAISFGFKLKPTIENVEFEQDYWDKLYASGRWAFLHGLHELAHYSVIVGYCQFFSSEGSFLEIGCGEGILQQRLKVLSYKSYKGIDISQSAIDIAEKFKDYRTQFTAGDAFTLLSEVKYDVIIFNESLYCFNDCILVLDHFANMLTENGIFVISMHVQEISKSHWDKIETQYKVIDSVFIENSKGVQWKCGAVKRK